MITYKKQSLFDAPEGSIIVHAVNARGVWGSGIAKEFKSRYPKSFDEYHEWCTSYEVPNVGTSRIAWRSLEEKHYVGWICTSKDYGANRDSSELIKINTTLAIYNLCRSLRPARHTIYSNKFNSGLFGVPWEESELILKTVLVQFPSIEWIVCDPDL